MAGIIFAVVYRDPVSGEQKLNVDIDWNLGTAAIVADTLGGTVVAAVRGPWERVPAEVVASSLETSKQATIDSELEKMLGGDGT